MTAVRPRKKQQTDIDNPPSLLDSRKWYSIGLIVSLLLLLATAAVVYKYPAMGWEQAVFVHINGLPDSWNIIFLTLTMLGSRWMAVASVVVTFFFKLYWLTWRLAISILLGYGLAFVIKQGISRARPEGLYADVHLRAHDVLAGFVSAHTMVAAIIVLTLFPFMPKRWRWVIAIVFVGVIGFSRVYLGVHAPLDIVGGAALGVAVVCFIRLLPQKVREALRLGS